MRSCWADGFSCVTRANFSWAWPEMEFVFYYDLVCPFAYIASRVVEGLAHRANATIRWRPVLLGNSRVL